MSELYKWEILNQLRGRLVFDELIEVEDDLWRGFNNNSDFIIEISLNHEPTPEVTSVIGIAVSENEMRLDSEHLFGTKLDIKDIQSLLLVMNWKAKQVMPLTH